MNRLIGVAACLVATTMLFPASAEAKRRFGGGSRAVAPATTQAKPSRSLVVVPAGIGASRARGSESGAPARVPFPPATVQQGQPAPNLASATAGDAKPVWCRSEVVVGGFCMIN